MSSFENKPFEEIIYAQTHYKINMASVIVYERNGITILNT